MMLNCDRLWTELVTLTYRLRRLPRVTNDPPPIEHTSARLDRVGQRPHDAG
jgi:hypothetical protein